MNTWVESIISFASVTVAAAAAVTSKSLWNFYVKKAQEADKDALVRRMNFLERQLSDFFWPLYIRLEKDTVSWEPVRGIRKPEQTDEYKIAVQVDKGLLDNHAEILKLLDDHIHLALPDDELEQLLMKYVRHVNLYVAMRRAGINKDFPFDHMVEYPTELFSTVKNRTDHLQREYDRLVKVIKAPDNV